MRTFYEWLVLNESMDVHVKDYDSSNDIRDLPSLCYSLVDKVINRNLWLKLSAKEKSEVGREAHSHGFIAPDGVYYTDGEEVINVYIGGWPDPGKLLSGVKYYLDEVGAKYTVSSVEKSGMFESPVVRIRIESWKPTVDAPPQLNLANSNAHLIFGELLGLSGEEGGYFDISVKDLYRKIEELEGYKLDIHARDPYSIQKPGMAKINYGGLSAGQIAERLETIKQICLWASDKGYDYLYVA